jgi:CBS domain-containing protein
MGDFAVKPLENQSQYKEFFLHLLNEVDIMDQMVAEGMFETGIQRIGTEQELSLVNLQYEPSTKGPEILAQITDDHYTSELARYNLEVNLSPYELKQDCFSRTEADLKKFLTMGQEVAARFDALPILVGILPTINEEHLQFDYMTPVDRYKALSDMLRELRGQDFQIFIQGRDDLIASLDTVLFEACNTSFQQHLQITAEEFVPMYNWSQAIAGPVMSIGANSPFLMGRQLWMETRIALFQQSIDTRTSRNSLRDSEPRVNFGHGWLRNSISEIYKEHIARFPLLFAADFGYDAKKAFQQGKIVDLKALRLHNGTVYTWNRPCFGVVDGVAHLRIENRYIPAGPSVVDEIANFAFWVGLMKGMPKGYENIQDHMDFGIAKANFYRAAKEGVKTVFQWFGGSLISAQRLILEELLPMAERGLQSVNIDEADISRLLGIIEMRALKGCTGATWQVENFRKLADSFGRGVANKVLTEGIINRQLTGEPVHHWDNIDPRRFMQVRKLTDRVRQIMITDLFTVKPYDLVSFVKSVMKWRNFNHIPVEDESGKLVGLLTTSDLEYLQGQLKQNPQLEVKEVMITKLFTLPPSASIAEAKEMIAEHGIGCLPIVSEGEMVGMITRTDLAK